MSNIKKLALAGIFVALGVVCSVFYIPIGVAKVFPVQHMINVLAGVILGPVYAVSMAFVTSLIRIIMGTGSLLAFPGSMCGALLCGLLYKYTKNTFMAFVGEVFGTGIIGAILAYPIATMVLSKSAALFGFVIPFGLSTLVGATISFALLQTLKKTGIFNKFKLEENYEL
jgi:energy coupling factor transporter S component ThiW